MARGIALIVAAVVLGVVLLQATDDPEPFVAANGTSDRPDDRGGESTDTTVETTTTTAAARPPGEVTVLVANASGVSGAAATLTDRVAELGYKTAPAANSDPADASVVYFTPGYEPEAQALAEQLRPGLEVRELPDPSPLPDLRGANVIVIQAADLAESA